MITELIDKQDNFEVVRDQIAAILVTETVNQMQLATDAGKDPDLWKLRVFKERSNPWELYLNEQTDRSPLINVWYDNSTFDQSGSNIMERQQTTGIFNIDCYGFGVSENDPSGGHIPGDREAAYSVQRALRLARNILMSANYTYLGLRGLVWRRWPQSITVFQPQLDGRHFQQIVGARIAFNVVYNEFSPQIPAETLELLSVQVTETDTGEVLINADYQY